MEYQVKTLQFFWICIASFTRHDPSTKSMLDQSTTWWKSITVDNDNGSTAMKDETFSCDSSLINNRYRVSLSTDRADIDCSRLRISFRRKSSIWWEELVAQNRTVDTELGRNPLRGPHPWGNAWTQIHFKRKRKWKNDWYKIDGYKEMLSLRLWAGGET